MYLHKMIVFCLLTCMALQSCDKQNDWLEQKQNKGDVMPSTLKELQAVLDGHAVMNQYYPVAGLVGSDNNLVADASLLAQDPTAIGLYLWEKDVYQNGFSPDWNYPYKIIEYANIVLDRLGAIKSNDENAAQVNNVKGSALFYRSMSFYNLAQLFCKPYTATAASDPGIVLRQSPDVNEKSVRATVKETYTRIIEDVKTAISLLPAVTPYKTRPTSVSAHALLAKTYFVMADYENALNEVDIVLKTYGELIDYNTLNAAAAKQFPSFTQGNPEIVFYADTYGYSMVWPATSISIHYVEPSLYAAYEAGDRRKDILYRTASTPGQYAFRASYEEGSSYNFAGIATNELYLLRAECFTRKGKLTEALADINTLLQKRYTPASFKPWSSADRDAIIDKIILERRKELPYTGNLRWEDLRRLNQEPRFAITLTRQSQGKTYTLPPNDPRYVLPIPNDEIRLSGIAQNPR